MTLLAGWYVQRVVTHFVHGGKHFRRKEWTRDMMDFELRSPIVGESSQNFLWQRCVIEPKLALSLKAALTTIN
jgi:hypothetical protein